MIVPVLLLIMIPFNQCALQMYLRNMKSLNEYTITAWLTISLLLVFLPVCYVAKPVGTFEYMARFNATDWLISFAFGLTGVYSQTTRAKAVHYEESAKLAVLNYFQSVI